VRGWTPDGQEVDLNPRQAECVRALLTRFPATLPARGCGFGWSVVMATAARYDVMPGCRCIPEGPDAFLTRDCGLHNPSSGLLIDRPAKLTGRPEILGVKVDYWADIKRVTPEQFMQPTGGPGAGEDRGADRA
jgi:hypothetical protein